MPTSFYLWWFGCMAGGVALLLTTSYVVETVRSGRF